jgi:hypothetical protein
VVGVLRLTEAGGLAFLVFIFRVLPLRVLAVRSIVAKADHMVTFVPSSEHSLASPYSLELRTFIAGRPRDEPECRFQQVAFWLEPPSDIVGF